MAIIIGADRLGNLELLLKQRGLSVLKHISGRHSKSQGGQIVGMARASVMILFTDFVGHNVMHNFRKQAKKQNIPFVACKRNLSDLTRSLDKYGFA